MIRRVCTCCKRLVDHRIVRLGDGMRARDWHECQRCQHMTPRSPLRSDWAGA